MKTIKIEIFNDKSYIRFYQYENLKEENEQLKKEIIEIEKVSDARWEENQKLKEEFEKLKQEKANCIKMLKDWENLVCVGLSEGCCPSCEVCLFGELKEQTEKIKGIERL